MRGYTKLMSLMVVVLVAAMSGVVYSAETEIDCMRPPRLVDPTLCCQDGGRDEVAENCAKKLGIVGKPNEPPPSMETASCLAECILRDSQYLQEPENINMDTIRSDLQAKFSNDSAYVQTLSDAFEKCQPSTVRKLAAIKQALPMSGGSGGGAMRRFCSPYSGMLLSCTYMEYFRNCPANRWTDSAECSLAKQFVTQCGLAA